MDIDLPAKLFTPPPFELKKSGKLPENPDDIVAGGNLNEDKKKRFYFYDEEIFMERELKRGFVNLIEKQIWIDS